MFPLNLFGQEGIVQEKFFAFMKLYIFPIAYFYLYPMGLWYGTVMIFKPDVTKSKRE